MENCGIFFAKNPVSASIYVGGWIDIKETGFFIEIENSGIFCAKNPVSASSSIKETEVFIYIILKAVDRIFFQKKSVCASMSRVSIEDFADRSGACG